MSIESEKSNEKIELKIIPPNGDKGWMIGFTAESEKICQAYNYAIRKVCDDLRLNPFHQVGVTPFGENESGYHAWEFWKETNEGDLVNLLPKIEEVAEDWLGRWAK